MNDGEHAHIQSDVLTALDSVRSSFHLIEVNVYAIRFNFYQKSDSVFTDIYLSVENADVHVIARMSLTFEVVQSHM